MTVVLTAEEQARVQECYAERVTAERLLIAQSQKEHGVSTSRGLFLANGAAAIAMLALLGSDFGRHATPTEAAILLKGARFALSSFAIGVMLSVATSALSYLNADALLRRYPTPAELHDVRLGSRTWREIPRFWMKFVDVTYWGAWGTSIASAICFMRGGLFMAHAMKQLALHLA